ncbi:MAG: hypothetical protein KF905_11115 [Flavobacteriales bacterium]|nr:hypothetical protein [Flavobacteriales bacterium]
MNEGTLDRKRFEAIEAYVMGRMSDDERARFEQDMATDPTLRAEVDLQRENTMAIELGGMDRLLKQVRAEQQRTSEGSGGNGWTTYLKYAAAIALLIAGALWWLDRAPQHDRLFAEHHVADPGLPVPMSLPAERAGATNDAAFHDAMVAYKLGDFAEARSKWTSLLNAAPGNDTLRYYIAQAALAEGDADSAVPLFEQVAADAASVFSGKARWYLFLAHLKRGDRTAMQALHLEDDAVYGERARAILEAFEP